MRIVLNRRRLLGTGALGASGLMLAGCDRLNSNPAFRSALQEAGSWHQGTQRLIGGQALAREYAPADMSPVFRVNGTADPATADYNAHVGTGFAKSWAAA